MISERPDFVHGRHWRELSPKEGKRKYRAEARDMQIEVDRPLTKIISFRDRHGREWARFSGPIFSLSPTYQWNMNSPKRWVPILGWIGTPDFRGDVTGLGGNIQASGFHDGMGQFLHTEHFPLTPLEVDQCFYDINVLAGFPGALPYFSAVRAARKAGLWKHKPDGEHSVILHDGGEYAGARCPLCLWALYDGDWCQGPPDCPNRGQSVTNPVRLTNSEAIRRINERNQ